jgi:hypothetical protein
MLPVLICTEINGGSFSVGAQDNAEDCAGDRREIFLLKITRKTSVPGFRTDFAV